MVISRPLVRWAQEFDHCDQLATDTIPDLQEGNPFDVLLRRFHASRCFKDAGEDAGLFALPNLRSSHREIAAPDPGLGRQVMDIKVLLELDDVVWANLRNELPAHGWQELEVKVLPELRLIMASTRLATPRSTAPRPRPVAARSSPTPPPT